MLLWLARRIEASTLLLSFNGRSFDWPLLRSRYVMNRLPPPPERLSESHRSGASIDLRPSMSHTAQKDIQ